MKHAEGFVQPEPSETSTLTLNPNPNPNPKGYVEAQLMYGRRQSRRHSKSGRRSVDYRARSDSKGPQPSPVTGLEPTSPHSLVLSYPNTWKGVPGWIEKTARFHVKDSKK